MDYFRVSSVTSMLYGHLIALSGGLSLIHSRLQEPGVSGLMRNDFKPKAGVLSKRMVFGQKAVCQSLS